MHHDLFYESIFFCSRNDLERLQPVSRSLLNMIAKASKVLPLRAIHRVDMDCGHSTNKVSIFVRKPAAEGASKPDYEASLHDGDFAGTFFRLQHVVVEYFRVLMRYSPFLLYWKAQGTVAFIVLDICFGLPKRPDGNALDSIVNHLRPRRMRLSVEKSSWQENGHKSEYLKLMARYPFLHHVQNYLVNVGRDAFPPPSFVFNAPGYANYELWCLYSFEAVPGIDGLIESFKRDGCANKKLASVCIVWDDRDYTEQPPVSEHLRKPTKIDMVPLPNDKAAWFAPYIHRVSQCTMHSFENTKQRKRMEAFKWSVECDYGFGHRLTRHLLLCEVKNF